MADGGDDWIEGGEGSDVIYGDADFNTTDTGGNDTIFGGDDNDLIYGNGGNDELYGGSGDDTIYGGYGNDFLDGGTGNDTLRGENDDDTLVGGEGSFDVLYGGDGDDELYGDFIVDTTYGGDDDIIIGGAGNDLIVGGGGGDTMTGGVGESDIFKWGAYDAPEVFLYNFVGVTTATVGTNAFDFELETSTPGGITGGTPNILGPGLADVTEATNTEYNALAVSDDGLRYRTVEPGSSGENSVFWMQFNLDQDVSEVSKIELLIEARQEGTAGTGSDPTGPAHFAVWNYATSSWETFESFEQPANLGDHNYTVTLMGNVDDYLGGFGNNTITALLINSDDQDWLEVDYAEVVVHTDLDIITDFETTEDQDGVFTAGVNDTLDLADLLGGYGFDANTDDVNDWVKLVSDGTDTLVQIDIDGAGSGTDELCVVKLLNVDLTGVSAQDLVNNGNLDVTVDVS
jgi:hypothetical protein